MDRAHTIQGLELHMRARRALCDDVDDVEKSMYFSALVEKVSNSSR